jgi:hypothetical protein
MRLSRLYLWTIAATIIAAVALMLNELLGAMYLPSAWPIVGILSIVLGYSVVALGCAAAYENGKAPRLMRSGMIIGLIALATALAIAFTPDLRQTFAPIRFFVWLTIWPCLMSVSGLLLLLPMHSGWRWRLRASTLIALTVLALFIGGAYAFYPDVQYDGGRHDWDFARRYEDGALQIGLALSMLVAALLATTLLVGIMTALTGRSAAPQPVARLPYWLQCPRCGREQQALTGDYHCTACNLRTRMDLV